MSWAPIELTDGCYDQDIEPDRSSNIAPSRNGNLTFVPNYVSTRDTLAKCSGIINPCVYFLYQISL